MSTLSNFLQRAERLERQFLREKETHFKILGNYSFSVPSGEPGRDITYLPCKTALNYHQSCEFVRGIMGPYGSGKSTASIAEIVMRTVQMPKCKDGIRRAKCAVIRNTAGELETSVIPTWMTWFSHLGSVHQTKKPVYTLTHKFSDEQGIVELKLVFLSCDREDDLKKLKSTEFTFAYLNEANELPHGLLDVIKGRVNGRYPSKVQCPHPYFTGILFDMNPPSNDHWMYRLFEEERPQGYVLFKQPSGLIEREDGSYVRNPDCDNFKNLSPDYYEKMAIGADREFVKVYCMGLYGIIKRGTSVYPSYNDDYHSVPTINLEKHQPIYLGFDLGTTPACLLSQFVNGQWRWIKEFVTNFNSSMLELCEAQVSPWLNRHAEGHELIIDYDPANPAGQALGISPAQIIAQTLNVMPCPGLSNNPQTRIDAVKKFLSRLVNGHPALIVSREGCPVARKGLYGDYQFKKAYVQGEDTYREVPSKTHPVSDIQDAAQYTAMRLASGYGKEPKIDISNLLERPMRARFNAGNLK